MFGTTNVLRDPPHNFLLILSELKDTDRGNLSQNKTNVLAKSINIDILVVGTSNELFDRGSYTQLRFSKN